MTEDFFNLILSQTKTNFKQINNPPLVVYNSKKGTVSVRYEFALGLINKVKIIAPCKVWLDLRNRKEIGSISFEVIAPWLYRPSKSKIKALKQYSDHYPGSFGADFEDCVKWSLTKNPLVGKGA